MVAIPTAVYVSPLHETTTLHLNLRLIKPFRNILSAFIVQDAFRRTGPARISVELRGCRGRQ